MQIRSVTLFIEPDYPPEDVADFIADARQAFHVPVQTVRLATTSFPSWWAHDPATFAADWQAVGIDYISLGTVKLTQPDGWLKRLPELVGVADTLFANVEIADTRGRISLARCRQMGNLVKEVSQLRPDGFGNLFLTAVANCDAGSPFFPVACSPGGATHFALALEAADLAVTAVRGATSLDEARQNLIAAIEKEAAQLVAAAEALAEKHILPFNGLDFSLAPFPTAAQSLAAGIEALGVELGRFGGLFGAAFITDAIDRADFPSCGFSGLMLPVLEDSILATHAETGQLSVQDLLLYCAVCGVGLDTIPLAGDVAEESLAAILADVAALATRLNKPLTARLMPLPGRRAGDAVHFDFPYFASSRVMPVSGRLNGLSGRAGELILNSIFPRGFLE